jgi:hypothetical protein
VVLSPLARWLRLNTFRCRKLAARLTPGACVERQDSKDQLIRIGTGRKFRQRWTPADHYCQSGKCRLGKSKRRKPKRKAKRRTQCQSTQAIS